MRPIILLLITVFLFSCSKSENDSLVPPQQPKLLVKFIRFDTTRPAGLDTVSRTIIQYDGRNRPVHWSFLGMSPDGSPYYLNEQQYFYNGNDTFAYQTIDITKIIGTNPPYEGDTTHYTFANGRLVRDSIFSTRNATGEQYYQARSYSFVGNTVVMNAYIDYYATPFTRTSNIYQTISGGNIIYQLDTAISISSGSPFQYIRTEQSATYLPNDNPMARISNPIRKPELESHSRFSLFRNFTTKLPESHSWERSIWAPGSSVDESLFNINYTYEFDADGLPLIMRELWQNGDQFKSIFIYQ